MEKIRTHRPVIHIDIAGRIAGAVSGRLDHIAQEQVVAYRFEAGDPAYHRLRAQVLNGQLGQNFFSFINNYRINYAKELMADPDKDGLAIVDLAFEVGFKSKSSFYDAFKKAMNQTPAQYRKSLKTDSLGFPRLARIPKPRHNH